MSAPIILEQARLEAYCALRVKGVGKIKAAEGAGFVTRREREKAEQMWAKSAKSDIRGTLVDAGGVAGRVAAIIADRECHVEELQSELLGAMRTAADRLGVGAGHQLARTNDLTNASLLIIDRYSVDGAVVGTEKIPVNWNMLQPDGTLLYNGVCYSADRIVPDNPVRLAALKHMADLTGTRAETVLSMQGGVLKNARLRAEVKKEQANLSQQAQRIRIVRPDVPEEKTP